MIFADTNLKGTNVFDSADGKSILTDFIVNSEHKIS
jgi:hypothetical protein